MALNLLFLLEYFIYIHIYMQKPLSDAITDGVLPHTSFGPSDSVYEILQIIEFLHSSLGSTPWGGLWNPHSRAPITLCQANPFPVLPALLGKPWDWANLLRAKGLWQFSESPNLGVQHLQSDFQQWTHIRKPSVQTQGLHSKRKRLCSFLAGLK